MKRIALLFLAVVLICSLFSACGTTEPEAATTVATTAATTEVCTDESTFVSTVESSVPETSVLTTASETETSTEITLSPEELAVQENEELKFKNVMVNFTHVNFELQNEIPGGDNELADIVSGMSTKYSVGLEDELLDEIRLMLSEPYLMVEDGAEWEADEPTAVVQIRNITGLETEKGTFRFYFRYDPNDSAENSGLIPLCYTEVGFKTYVYRLTEDAVEFYDSIFDGLYIRSADTWYEYDTEATDVTLNNAAGAELTEGEIEQQEIINNSVTMRVKVIPYFSSWDDELREHLMDFRCIYEITDEEIISEFCTVTDKANLIKYDEFLGLGRGGEWSLQVTFISDAGEENTYYFTRSYTDGQQPGMWHQCITNVGEDWYMYGMHDETIDLLDCFFDKLELKSMTTR